MHDHYHCKGIRCYNRMQFAPVCSRCDGLTTECDGDCNAPRASEMLDKLGIPRPDTKPPFATPTSVDEADELMEGLR